MLRSGVNSGTTLTLTGTIGANIGGDEGGGLQQDSGGTLPLTNSTVGVIAVDVADGSVILNNGTLTLD